MKVIYEILLVSAVVACTLGLQLDVQNDDGSEVEDRFFWKKEVLFHLYTQNNPTVANLITIGEGSGLDEVNFDRSKPVKVVVHGWNQNGNSDISKEIRNAFLNIMDVNVIVVDWSKGAFGLYTTSVLNTPQTGEAIAKLVDWLVQEGVSIQNFHLIGFDLGAHAVGIAGRTISSGSVPYITGLDPVMLLWGKYSDRLRSSDADYVEVIHTNMNILGLEDQIGDNDFYPNGGYNQPGCSHIFPDCSHERSWRLYADSLDHTGFRAIQCKDLNEIRKGKCSNIGSMHMGGSEPKPAMGIFYLETAKEKPYYLG